MLRVEVAVAIPVAEANDLTSAETVERRRAATAVTAARARVVSIRMESRSLLPMARISMGVKVLGLSVHGTAFRSNDLLIGGPYIMRPCMT